MSDSIRIHPKFGLNPTMPQCVICGKATGEIILGGRFKDKNGNPCEAPMYCGVISPVPCPDCKEKYLKDGVLMIEAFPGDGRPEMAGPVAVITDEAFSRIINQPLPPKKICYVEVGFLKKIGAIE